MRSKFFGLAVAAMVGGTASAHANLVTNGDFESSDLNLTGWTVSNGAQILPSTAPVIDGNVSAQLGDTPSPGTLSQVLPTINGTTYTISFLLQNFDNFSSNSFAVTFGGDTLLALTNAGPDNAPVPESFTDTPGANATLAFTDTNDNSFWLLDDVVVTPVQTGVPEPSTIALIGGGLLITGLAARRRRRRLTKE